MPRRTPLGWVVPFLKIDWYGSRRGRDRLRSSLHRSIAKNGAHAFPQATWDRLPDVSFARSVDDIIANGALGLPASAWNHIPDDVIAGRAPWSHSERGCIAFPQRC